MKRGVRPDMVTDQTSAHDPLHGYLPKGWSWEEYQQKAEPTRRALFWRRNARWPITCRRCWPSMRWGPNLRLRQQHPPDGAGSGRQQRLRFPGLRAGLYPPAVLPRYRPVRWVALSGDPQDIYKTDAKVKEIIKDDQHLHHWLDMARERISFQGLPARICWVGLEWRQKLGLAFNEMVRSGEVSAPIVIGRDHLDSGSVASPNRETEAMRDGSGCGLRLAAAQRPA